ncbi:hypothetical protein ASG89_33670 [Paenibacillus sp. Soil766]|uniref:DUF5050 domain-containing protein n=1 Tax=Paenibacillus sp. Soil766 TaxID=1736404 RepID=UPI00070964ED|nr:DUF5050 domain-containing protein [Paenibacillus sp. Soil766]KRE92115.1 hypothetical protein ASG89_33670 [Paenibacillus sp. Soil766]
MIKRWIGCAAAASLCVGLLAPVGVGVSHAADAGVRVTLPTFQVSLNEHTVDNQYREYPLLVYKDITYFPMTWYDSRLLGLEATWTEQDGLEIAQDPVTSSYVSYQTDRRNASAYTAEVPASAITINGKVIDNTNEPYPLLSFRDVTYFPLTWRYAHDEFGWEYEWDTAAGLTIRSGNPQLLTVELPEDAGENDVVLYKGYYYFAETEGTENRIYRAPAQHPSDKVEIYTYSIENGYGVQKQVSFKIREDGLWLLYHIGGATMGHDEFVKISDDGKAEVRHQGYLDFRDTPNGTLIVNLGNPPFAGNLSLVPTGQQALVGKAVGSPDLLYGRHVTVSESSVGVGGDGSSTTVIGDDAYVLGSSYLAGHYDDLNKIYRINLKSNEIAKIINAGVQRLSVIDDRLYYVKDADSALYVSNRDGTGERKLSEHAVSWFAEVGDNVYYTTEIDNNNNYELSKVGPAGNDVAVYNTLFRSVQVVDGKLVCILDEKDDYRAVVLDSSGNLILTVTDPVTRVLASDDGILLASSGKVVRLTDLPNTAQAVAPGNHALTFVPLTPIDGKWAFEHQYDDVAFNNVYSIGNHVAPNLTYPRPSPGEEIKAGDPVPINLSLINRNSDPAVVTVIEHDFEIQILSHGKLVWRGKVPATANIPLNNLATMGIDFTWDQKGSDGKQVPAGQYSVYLLTPAEIEYTIEGKAGTFTEHIDHVSDKTIGGGFSIQE